jgi:hypothetical protein
LDDYGVLIRRDAERYWDMNKFSIREWNEDGVREGGIWFKTMGCSHEWSGGCVMCDYSFGSKTDSSGMIDCVEEALESMQEPCHNLIITGLATLFWTKLLRTRNYFNYSSYPADFRVFNPLYSTGVR